MPAQSDSGDEQSRRLVYFAAERTLTSWIRTALSLMVLGFAMDRFDLVLRGAAGDKSAGGLHSQELWRWGGSTLIALGVLMAVLAGIYYLSYGLRYLRTRSTDVSYSLVIGALFTLVLAACGVAVLAAVLWVT